MDKPKFAGNTDTGLLKTVAFITMLADHVGYLFFPDQIGWRLIGRIAFPLFAYCLVLGFFFTRDIKKYFLRLFGFSLISQIPYTFCFFPHDIGVPMGEFHLNIGFTMMLGLLAVFGISRKKYFYTVIALLLSLWPPVEYGFYGVAFIVVVYFFAFEKKALFGMAAGISLAFPLLEFFSDGVFDLQCFAVLALPFMLINTDTKIKIPRWLSYGFYPAHLCVLILISFLTA